MDFKTKYLKYKKKYLLLKGGARKLNRDKNNESIISFYLKSLRKDASQETIDLIDFNPGKYKISSLLAQYIENFKIIKDLKDDFFDTEYASQYKKSKFKDHIEIILDTLNIKFIIEIRNLIKNPQKTEHMYFFEHNNGNDLIILYIDHLEELQKAFKIIEENPQLIKELQRQPELQQKDKKYLDKLLDELYNAITDINNILQETIYIIGDLI